MAHIEYWIANDGTQFDSIYDCVVYEFKQKLNASTLRGVHNNEVYCGEKLMDNDVYNVIESVIVASENDLKLIKELYNWDGFFLNVDSVGIWKWESDMQKWVRKENSMNNYLDDFPMLSQAERNAILKEMKKPIYTHNIAAEMIEVFENELDKRGIKIPDEDRTGDKSEAAIYGMTYANLLDDIECLLMNICEQAKADYISDVFE